jgi:hypothetical protein
LGVADEREAALVDETVVAATEQDQVVEVGSSSLCPGDDVVGIDPTAVVAAGKATAPVALAQGEIKARRDRASLSAQIEHLFAALDQDLE